MGAVGHLNALCEPVSEFWGTDAGGSAYRPSDNATTPHDRYDITLCFEDTAIFYSISIIFWVLAGLKLLCGRQRKTTIPINKLNTLKVLLVGFPLSAALCDFFFTIEQRSKVEVALFQYMTPTFLSLTLVLAGVVTYHERRVGVHSSGLLHIFWMAMVLYGVTKLRTLILIAEGSHGVTDVFRFTTFCLQFVSYIVEFILVLIPEPLPTPIPCGKDERKPCPEQRASFLSLITWWWINGLIWRGWKKALEDKDLTDINEEDKSQTVTAIFNKNWNQQLQKANVGRSSVPITRYMSLNEDLSESYHDDVPVMAASAKPQATLAHQKEPSLLVAMAKSFWQPFLTAGLFKLLNDLLSFVNPFILKLMLDFVSDQTQPTWRGYVYAVMFFVTAVVQSQCLHQYYNRALILGMRVRTALVAAIYSKTLCLSSLARRSSTIGEIVNMMSVDAQCLMDLCSYIHFLWFAPLQVILTLLFLWFTMGPSIFAGVGVMVLLAPVNALVAALNEKLQTKEMTYKDSRTKLTNEVLNGIKVIKLYAWEIPFQRLIMAVRNQELGVLKKSAYLTAIITFTWTSAPFFVSLATFTTFSLMHKDGQEGRLTADKAFVALSLFNILSTPMTMLPIVISSVVQAMVSTRRLSSFLKGEELDPNGVIKMDTPPSSDDEDVVTVTGATFTWDSPEKPVLSNLNLHIRPGQLVAVVGQVGAGKSSLISALLGEVEKVEGTVTIRGRVAYVPQQAWIQNASVKDNILFGQSMNGTLYSNTLSSCALGPDLDILPAGDATEIGEKGINLSGGQKQRVSLARAVYQQADIYLMDDPLSAVDAHVGKHIFEKAIGPEGLLQGKVRVLVTHGLTFLPQCDLIVVLDEGRIREMGTYSELVNNKGAFAEFLQTYATTEEGEGSSAERLKGMKPGGSPLRGGTSLLLSGEQKEPLERRPTPERRPRTPLTASCMSVAGVEETAPLTPSEEEEKIPKDVTERSSLISAEQAEVGRVKWSVLVAYFRAGGYLVFALVFFLYAMGSGSSAMTNLWLSYWSNAEATNASVNLGYYLGTYSGLGVVQALLTFLATFAAAVAGIRASRTLHNTMLERVLRAPMQFFDTTPLGRILNRFSKDMYMVDGVIPTSMEQFMVASFIVVMTVIVITYSVPIFGTMIIPLGIVYVIIQRFYVSTSRQLQRIESVSRSPIYSHFQESIQGASSIRAYRVEERFILENERRVDHNLMAYFPTISSNRWLAIRLEFVGNLIIFFTALFAAVQRDYESQLGIRINPGLVGVSISCALQVTGALNWTVRMTSQLESNIVAAERIKEYAEVETEAPTIIPSRRPPDGWPTAGEVRFEGYSTRYREGMDLVLKDISVTVPGGTKIGIVGRTGAGKTSMTLALFRIIEAVRGIIQIDGVNIADIGIQDLRSRITIIPQDPVLFSGTLRLNLDPFNAYTDEDLWRVLEIAHLRDFVSTLAEGLTHPVSEGGENLSVGQRQLVCLARALLRKTKILVLDEATAAVDMETDDFIQKTIRSEFATCTVFTIAHRLNTIMDYDYVLVLGAGKVLEYASPTELLANSSSVFYSMAKDAGLVPSKDAGLAS